MDYTDSTSTANNTFLITLIKKQVLLIVIIIILVRVKLEDEALERGEGRKKPAL